MHPEIAEVLAGTRRWCVVTGDATEIVPTLPTVDAVVTDPPFGMAFRSNYRIERHDAINGDGDSRLMDFACRIPVRHSRYVFGRWNNLRHAEPKSVVTWVKNNWSMGDLEHEHARQTESIFFWPGPAHEWVGKRPSDVVFHDRTGNEWHPTEKGLSLMVEVVSWTPEGAVVLDPFAGAGATGMACVQTGRRFIGIEIDENYASIARRRIAEADTHLFNREGP